ncbi:MULTISPECIES: DUF3392 domain-containing protein [Alkalimonas]|uniref:DUF3392 domain-containing protein n=1 Tax=Alkalimonas mucilaginosa TaxID=3057676 RepID=A0ABU7JHE0_9GAMM|nr:DUF3392 domain-containing protein [Alkalimonas sp. MEB004]MEE2024783.1 DUF3392 domain-containing protein [Alkalimonas sp. MEB004]
MDWLQEMLLQWGALFRPYVRDIALAMVATCLVVFGDDINRFIRRQIHSLHFIWRTLIFVLVCAFGYGAVTLFLTPIVAKQLAGLSNLWLPWVTLGIFTLLGILAQRRRQA